MVPSPSSGWGDIADARQRLGMTAQALWIGYFAVGGNGSLADVNEWLAGAAEIPARDHDLLAQVLNDVFCDQDLNHPVRYSRD